MTAAGPQGAPSPDVVDWCRREIAQRQLRTDIRLAELEKLTVIVPSYCRQDFLLRQVAYWAHLPTRLIITDGSPEPLNAAAHALVSSVANATYLHAPGSIESRLTLASRHIATPYAVFLGDDDLFLLTGAERVVAELEANPAVVGCVGQSLRFSVAPDAGSLLYAAGYPHWGYAAMEESTEERAVSAMAGYSAASCYAVLREPFWTRSWGALVPLSTTYAEEMQQALSVHLSGGVSSVTSMYWLRSDENPPVRVSHGAVPMSFGAWWRHPDCQGERSAFVDILAKTMIETTQVPHDEAERVVCDAVAAYIDKCDRASRPGGLGRVRNAARAGLSRTIRKALPQHVVSRLREFIRPGGPSLRANLAAVVNDSVIGRGLDSRALLEMKAIETFILGFVRARAGRYDAQA